jgi:hypothetical protein
VAKKKNKPAADGVVEVPMPIKGLDTRTALEYQPAGTSPDLQNVRGSRPDDGREGMCQRSGIQKYCPVQLDGESTPVQEIHKIIIDASQGQPFGIGSSYVAVGNNIYVLDTDGNVALVFPAPNGMTPGPGVFDQRGNLMQQNTSSTAFRNQKHNTAPKVQPPAIFSPPPWHAKRKFNPKPVMRIQGHLMLQQGGVNPQGRAEEGEEPGVEAIRNLDQFPAEGAGPPGQEWEGNGDLPGGGT